MTTEETSQEAQVDELLETPEEETPEEEVDESEEKSTEEEDSTEESEGEFEEHKSEEDYVESLGLGRKTFEEVATDFKQKEEQLAAIKEHQATTGFEPYKPPVQEKQDEHKFLADRGLATKHVSQKQFNTDEAGQKSKANYSALAQVIDSTFDPALDQIETVLQDFRGTMAFMVDHIRKSSYEGLPNKNLVSYKDIEGILNQRNILDAGIALREFLVYNKPELLSQLTQKAEKRGERRGQHKRNRKFSSVRRQKTSPKSQADWKPYFTQGEPNEKFGALSVDDKLKYAEAYKKSAERDIERG